MGLNVDFNEFIFDPQSGSGSDTYNGDGSKAKCYPFDMKLSAN